MMQISKKWYYASVNWDWKWFGFEISFNGHEKYFNLQVTWLSINIYLGRQ
jgi:hypothetical protein